jgi:hypothetical protein
MIIYLTRAYLVLLKKESGQTFEIKTIAFKENIHQFLMAPYEHAHWNYYLCKGTSLKAY